MRVALIDPSLFTLPYDRMLALGLGAAGHQVTLYGRHLRADDTDVSGLDLVPAFYRFAEGRAAAWLPSAFRPFLKGFEHLACMAGLQRRLRMDPPDVVHFQWLPLPVLDRRFLQELRAVAPLVLTVHDSNPFNGDPTSALQRLSAASCFGAFDRLLVHTEQGRLRLIAQGVAPSQVVRVSHGLLAEPVAPAAAAPDLMTGTLTFLLFGTIKAYKGLDLLIEAFARLPGDLRAQARLHVIGRPQMDLAPIVALARLHGITDRLILEPRFATEAEVPALFGQGTVVVLPYREIDASGVLSLAIAHGRPIIASRIGGFAEILEDGAHGLLVPPDNPDALADALARLLRDRVFTARCAARVCDLASAVPGWKEIGRHTAELYADAVTARRLAPEGTCMRRFESQPMRPGI